MTPIVTIHLALSAQSTKQFHKLGLTDHVWTLRDVLVFRVPPWLQP